RFAVLRPLNEWTIFKTSFSPVGSSRRFLRTAGSRTSCFKSAKRTGNAFNGRSSIMNGPAGVVPLPLLEVVSELGEVFDRFQVRYALIGALAAGYRSRARSTRDADFLLNIPQLTLPTLLDELQARGFEFDMTTAIREWTQRHMVVLSYHGVRVDW